jgi:hypothetical protein
MAWMPVGATPVPTSPERRVKAAPIWAGDKKLTRFWKGSRRVPPRVTNSSSAFATAR